MPLHTGMLCTLFHVLGASHSIVNIRYGGKSCVRAGKSCVRAATLMGGVAFRFIHAGDKLRLFP